MDNFSNAINEMSSMVNTPSSAPTPASAPSSAPASAPVQSKTPATSKAPSTPSTPKTVKMPKVNKPAETKEVKLPIGKDTDMLDSIMNGLDLDKDVDKKEYDHMNTETHPMDDYEMKSDVSTVNDELDELKELSVLGEEAHREPDIDTKELDEQVSKEAKEPEITPLEEVKTEREAIESMNHFIKMLETPTTTLSKLLEQMETYSDTDYASKSLDIETDMNTVAARINNVISYYDKLRSMIESKLNRHSN